MKNNFVIIGVLLIALVVIIVVFSKHDDRPTFISSDEPITLGFIAPLTGDAAAYGESIRRGVELATADINAEGGINGRELRVIYENGTCTGKDATSAAQKLISVDGVVGIIGGGCSNETIAFAPIAEENSIPVISPSASAPEISDAGDFIFRTAPSDTYAAIRVAEIIAEQYEHAAILTESGSYPMGVRNGFLDHAQSIGLSIVSDELFDPELTDFRSILLRVKEESPEALFINPQSGPAGARIAQQARELGIDAQFYAYFITGDEFVKSSAAVEGTILLDYPRAENQKRSQELIQKYEKTYGEDLQYGIFMTSGYDTVHIFAQAFEKVGTQGNLVRDYLYEMPAYDGAYAKLRFDENGDPIGVDDYVTLQIIDGELVEL